eukprot:COSAG01_NODE_1473_length_10193_cov_13.155736_8_plen_106_part_00
MSDGPTRLRSCVSFCGVCLSVSASVSLCVYVRSSEVAGAATHLVPAPYTLRQWHWTTNIHTHHWTHRNLAAADPVQRAAAQQRFLVANGACTHLLAVACSNEYMY